MKIFTLDRTTIQGAVAFPYRGYTISVSNILPPAETGIIDPAGDILDVSFSASVTGIAEAAAYIDTLINESIDI